ncbi:MULTISPECIES: flagellar biosynthesis protein FlhB [Bacillus]|uniref:flagellar biosynthesis protein FlhB n=1 Tax=Bacillus TaxID=1386 RepID=UPI0002E807DD|nr:MULTISPECIES: flagellar biosynthesis protein FlhB [Bacillus]
MEWLSLDLQFFSGEKTEKATPKKRQDARKKGQVAKSQDINTAFVLFASFGVLTLLGGYLKNIALEIYTMTFEQYMLLPLSEKNIHIIFITMAEKAATFLLPIMLATMVGGVIANYMQVGVLFSTETIQFKLNKINPISGFKRIFSLRAIVELFKSILKISLVGFVAFLVIWSRLDEILILSQKSVGAALATLADITVKVGFFSSLVLFIIAILDYFYQKYDFEKSIRMSKQDIKDEYKNTEGDPLIKSKIKQRQREMAMQRMMAEVPHADVVITNPTHFAIAIKYDESKSDAPYVVAKGVDFIAQKIKYVAKENNVITVENRPLARALYDQTEIGQVIPEEFFKAVAEILAFVYKTKGKI